MPPRKSNPKRTLAEEFRERIRAKGWTVRQAAERIGVVDATLRTWLARDRFPQKYAVALAGMLGWDITPDRMLAEFATADGWTRGSAGAGPVPTTLTYLFHQFDRKARRTARFTAREAEPYQQLFGVLAENDLGVFATATVTPPEMAPDAPRELLDQVAAGVRRGGRLLYLRPADEDVQRLRKQYDSALPYGGDIDEEVACLRAAVRARLPDGSDRANTHIVQVQCPPGDHTFLTPGFVIGMFVTFAEAQTLNRRMVVRLPASFGGAIFLPVDTPLQPFVERFCRFASRALEPLSSPAGVHAVRQILEAKLPRS